MSAPPGGAEVVVEHVRKGFEDGRIHALEDISLRIEPGEFVLLTGASGCGKSTLLNLIGALDRPDSGSIAVDGHHLEHLEDPSEYRAATVGFVFQAHNLMPTLNALENVQIPMIGRHVPRREREARARELLVRGRALGADARLTRRRSRAASASASRSPARSRTGRSCSLADEPTGALDSETGAQIVALLERLRRQHGMTILLVTNDSDLAGLGDRSFHMRDGRLELTRAAAPRSA